MKWLIKRLLVVCATLSICCTMVVVLGRLDHTPSRLQALGFDVCDGEPCFRGIKIDTDWATALKLFPEGVVNEQVLRVPSYLPFPQSVGFFPSKGYITVSTIGIVSNSNDLLLPLRAAEVIAQYGPPCRVKLDVSGGPFFNGMTLYYPVMEIRFIQEDYGDNPGDYGLDWNSPPVEFSITAQPYRKCNQPISEDFGPWHGFISAEAYHQDNLHDLGIIQPISNGP